jgi:MFS family permease
VDDNQKRGVELTNKTKLWTKDFVLVTLVTCLFTINYYLLMVLIPVYAIDTFNSSPSEAGLASGMFVVGAILPRLLSGKLIEKIGRKKTLYGGLILGLVMTILYFAANSYILLLVIRFFHGAAFGIVGTAAGTIAANIMPVNRRGEGMAYFISLSLTLAIAIGPFLGMSIYQHGSFNTIFGVCTIFMTLSLATMSILSVPEIKLTEEQLKETKEFKLKGFFATSAIPISTIFALLMLSYSSVITFLSAYSKEIDLADVASFFFVMFAITILISRPFAGRLFDSRGENIVMYPAILVFMIGLLTLSQTYHGYSLLLAGALIGLGLGTIQSSCQAIGVNIVSPHQIGLANSTMGMFVDVAVGIGPLIFGLLVPLAGYRGMYLAAAAMPLACLFLYYLLHGKKAKGIKV